MNASPANVHLISLGNCAKHIWFPSPWERAQPRFVRSMREMYVLNPTKQWYIFVDDDSYIFLNNLINILKGFNSSKKVVLGHFYCAWPEIVFGKNHTMQCLNFPQGGAGVAISRGMMEHIGDKLLKCNEKYNSRYYAGSMRFGKCILDHVTDGTWRHGDGIQNFKSQFNSRNPIAEIEGDKCHRPPATFHKLKPKDIHFVHNGHQSEWSTPEKKEMFVDWSHLTARPFLVFIDEHQPLHLRFGYAIATQQFNDVISVATSEILPEFDISDILKMKPTSYAQMFGESIKVKFECDDTVSDNDVAFESVEKHEFVQFNMKVACPVPQEYQKGNASLYI